MRALLLLVIGPVVLAVPLLAQGVSSGQGGGGEDKGVLGPVNALGQEMSRPPVPTGPPPRLPDGTVDLGDGVWIGGGPGDIDPGLPKGETLPLLPWAKALMDDRAKQPRRRPVPTGACRWASRASRRIRRASCRTTRIKPTHMFILHEGTIHTLPPDLHGRTQAPGGARSDVVRTLDRVRGRRTRSSSTPSATTTSSGSTGRGHPHTEQLHTIERWTRINKGTLINAVTIDDPGAFSRPFTVTFNARLAPPGDELMEYFCQENNQFGIAGGHTHPFAGSDREKR